MHSIIDLSPGDYTPHYIHGEGRCWAETNCYMDVLIELIHSLGFDPVAALPVTLSVDFEVDQWTFFKFEHADLLEMYGMEIHELNPWLSLAHHVEEQVNANRPVLVEMDSYFLPDTAGSAYKEAHVKSTIAVNNIDTQSGHMGYFHGQGYYELDGQDFSDIFQVDGLVHDRMLPPYIEIVKLHEVDDGSTLLDRSVAALRRQLRQMPRTNPFSTFADRFEKDVEWLRSENIEKFHVYSFATLRQYGACFELAETYLTWLRKHGIPNLDESIAAYNQISATAKVFQFKLARALARGKPLDHGPIVDMSGLWQKAVDQLTHDFA
ncbi:MAG: DUF1839 family protein [Gammaproteobacteria bacterium]|nr:DUF1839 family protein [Gammaproteobacteria bacterium]